MVQTDRSVGSTRVLLVEDERSIRDLVSDQLRKGGYDCCAEADGRRGLELILTQRFDVVVLDLMLPGVDGITLCRTARREGINRDAAILLLTARREESDKVLGFESGADDYVTKPFGVRELTARIAALTRRVHRTHVEPNPMTRHPIEAHGVALDPAKHVVRVHDNDVCLTPHEGPSPARPAHAAPGPAARASGPPALPPGWFGPEWPPTAAASAPRCRSTCITS